MQVISKVEVHHSQQSGQRLRLGPNLPLFTHLPVICTLYNTYHPRLFLWIVLVVFLLDHFLRLIRTSLRFPIQRLCAVYLHTYTNPLRPQISITFFRHG